MQILLPLMIAIIGYYFSKQIRLNSTILYLISLVIASFSIMYIDNLYFNIIHSGVLGISFFIVVMYTGAIKRGSLLKKQLSYVRRELAVLGLIFTAPYILLNIYYGFLGVIPFEPFGFGMFLLMIPLVVSSFNFVKVTIKTSKWIKLHRYAYLVYLLMFIHLMITSFGNQGLQYIIIFTGYLFFKLKNYVFEKHALLKSVLSSTSLLVLAALSYQYVIGIVYESYDVIEHNEFTDGTYIGTSDGFRGLDTEVRVTVINNQIKSIELITCGCTPNADEGYYLDLAYQQTTNIVKQNRTDIDAYSGATITSRAINDAVINALEQAKK